MTSALVTAVGLTLHNAAEGAAVCLASLKGLRFGLPITLAILAHNIPEGYVGRGRLGWGGLGAGVKPDVLACEALVGCTVGAPQAWSDAARDRFLLSLGLKSGGRAAVVGAPALAFRAFRVHNVLRWLLASALGGLGRPPTMLLDHCLFSMCSALL